MKRVYTAALTDEKRLKKCLNRRLLAAKERAEKGNFEFDINLDYLIELWDQQKGLCALSGISMTYEQYKGRTATNVSIDKKNRTLGYVRNNIQLVCMACNQIKSDLTEEEMYLFCKKIIEKYENKDNK